MNPIEVDRDSNESIKFLVESDDPTIFGVATLNCAFRKVGDTTNRAWLPATWHPILGSQGWGCTPKIAHGVLDPGLYEAWSKVGDDPTVVVLAWPRLVKVV